MLCLHMIYFTKGNSILHFEIHMKNRGKIYTLCSQQTLVPSVTVNRMHHTVSSLWQVMKKWVQKCWQAV